MKITKKFINAMRSLDYIQGGHNSWLFRRANQYDLPHHHIDFSSCENDITKIPYVIFDEGKKFGLAEKQNEVKKVLGIR